MYAMTGGDGWSIAPSRRTKDLTAALLTIAVHGAIGAGLWLVDPSRLARRESVVEMEVNEKPLPPPELRPEQPPPPPREPEPAPKARIVPRRLASAPKPQPAPPEAPPPPNQEPPKATDTPPVFGVTMSSVVAGDSPGMAVPVGNTLMTKERRAAKPGVVPPAYGAEGTHPFTPVADVYITDHPRVLHEVNSSDIYPPEAYRMGVEGRVVLKVSLSAAGEVVGVKVISKAGHGFDEAASDALRQFKFSPARASDGQAVDYSFTYTYVFESR